MTKFIRAYEINGHKRACRNRRRKRKTIKLILEGVHIIPTEKSHF